MAAIKRYFEHVRQQALMTAEGPAL